MAYSMCYDDAKTETKLIRTWSSSETPPDPVRVEFNPAGSASLTGTPTGDFDNANPGAGNPLVASLTPPALGRTERYTLSISDSGGDGETVIVELHWDG